MSDNCKTIQLPNLLKETRQDKDVYTWLYDASLSLTGYIVASVSRGQFIIREIPEEKHEELRRSNWGHIVTRQSLDLPTDFPHHEQLRSHGERLDIQSECPRHVSDQALIQSGMDDESQNECSDHWNHNVASVLVSLLIDRRPAPGSWVDD